MIDWNDCQKNLGISFHQESLLEQAFVHSSYLNENPGFARLSNERLEFLGDSILNFIIAEKLYEEFPKLPEGNLTEIRASLVCRDTLAGLASSPSKRYGSTDWCLLFRPGTSHSTEIYSQTAQAGIGKNKGWEDNPKLQGISARVYPGTEEANANLPFGGS
jgi:dsRNA-specific ribonuclease